MSNYWASEWVISDATIGEIHLNWRKFCIETVDNQCEAHIKTINHRRFCRIDMFFHTLTHTQTSLSPSSCVLNLFNFCSQHVSCVYNEIQNKKKHSPNNSKTLKNYTEKNMFVLIYSIGTLSHLISPFIDYCVCVFICSMGQSLLNHLH